MAGQGRRSQAGVAGVFDGVNAGLVTRWKEDAGDGRRDRGSRRGEIMHNHGPNQVEKHIEQQIEAGDQGRATRPKARGTQRVLKEHTC